MVFRRRYRKRGGRRRFNRGRARRWVRRIRKITKGTVRRMSEVKWVFTGINEFTAANSWELSDITPAVASGPDSDQRIGKKIRYKFLTLDLRVRYLMTTTLPTDYPVMCRVVLVSYRDATLTTAEASPLNSAISSEQTVWAPLNGKAVLVLKDWRFLLAPYNENDTGVQSQIPTTKRLSYHRRHIRNVLFTTSATPSNQEAKLGIMVSCTGTATTNGLELVGGHRMSYIDI